MNAPTVRRDGAMMHSLNAGRHRARIAGLIACCCAVLGLSCSGCGTMVSRTATEQLLMSDAVDRSVAHIDFRPLTGKKVFLDTRYIVPQKVTGFVSAEYVISSLRQQMLAANCLLQEKQEDAELVVEARVGALGSDLHEINYGLPASQALGAASTVATGVPAMPLLPEISFARKNDFLAAAKVGAFAYDRETKEPVWQSGLSQGRSDAHASWVLGAGPFERGSMHKETMFAGAPLRRLLRTRARQAEPDVPQEAQDISYFAQHRFQPDRSNIALKKLPEINGTQRR